MSIGVRGFRQKEKAPVVERAARSASDEQALLGERLIAALVGVKTAREARERGALARGRVRERVDRRDRLRTVTRAQESGRVFVAPRLERAGIEIVRGSSRAENEGKGEQRSRAKPAAGGARELGSTDRCHENFPQVALRKVELSEPSVATTVKFRRRFEGHGCDGCDRLKEFGTEESDSEATRVTVRQDAHELLIEVVG